MFNAIIVEPFGWILKQCYNLVGSYGVAIIIFSVIAKLVMLPFQMKSKKSMMDMQRIQPKLKEIEKKYKDDKERYSLEVQKLYKREGVSMMGGCLPLLITIPIMFGLYSVVRQPLTHIFNLSADQISQLVKAMDISTKTGMAEISIASNVGKFAEVIKEIAPNIAGVDFHFLGIDLAAIPNFNYITWLWAIPILSGLTSYGYSWITRKLQGAPITEQAKASNGMMNVLMPAMSVWIAFMVPAALGMYWIISNILSAVQEPLLTIYYKKKMENKENELIASGGQNKNVKKHRNKR